MESCSVGSIVNSKCGARKNNVNELPLGQVELLHIRSKIEPFTDLVDLCP